MPLRDSSGGAAFCELSRGKDALFAVWIRTLRRHGQLGREPEALGRELAGNASLVLIQSAAPPRED
jgi:hypothetical protein